MSDKPKPPIRIMNYEYKLYHTVDGKAAREYIEHLEAESSARMACIRHLRDQRAELGIQIMELEAEIERKDKVFNDLVKSREG